MHADPATDPNDPEEEKKNRREAGEVDHDETVSFSIGSELEKIKRNIDVLQESAAIEQRR